MRCGVYALCKLSMGVLQKRRTRGESVMENGEQEMEVNYGTGTLA